MNHSTINRRGFLGAMGAAATGLGLATQAVAQPQATAQTKGAAAAAPRMPSSVASAAQTPGSRPPSRLSIAVRLSKS